MVCACAFTAIAALLPNTCGLGVLPCTCLHSFSKEFTQTLLEGLHKKLIPSFLEGDNVDLNTLCPLTEQDLIQYSQQILFIAFIGSLHIFYYGPPHPVFIKYVPLVYKTSNTSVLLSEALCATVQRLIMQCQLKDPIPMADADKRFDSAAKTLN